MNEPARKITFAEYLEQERTSEMKHQLVNGEFVAMTGCTIEHGRLTSRVMGMLGRQIEGRPCEGYSCDVRIRVPATGFVTYPDMSIVCDRLERDPEDADTIINPVVLVEVLSASTERFDRGEKFAHYRRLPSLKEYVLVSERGPRIEVFQRNDDGMSWTLHIAEAGESVSVASIGCVLAVNDVYANPLESTP